jgi:release factor glutamine methyltransferase
MTIGEALHWAKSQLDTPNEADYLLSACINQSRSFLYTWPENELSDQELERFKHLAARRIDGEPIAYILGRKAFWNFELFTSTDTLIPREETEILVEAALSKIEDNGLTDICDLGTGTGAIALAIASEKPHCRVTGVDKVDGAITLAKKNAAHVGVTNVSFLLSDWFEVLGQQRFDLIVTNPPYVEAHSPYLDQGDVRFEPKTALTSGETGLDDINLIINRAKHHLVKGGWLMIEHGFQQHESVAQLLHQAGFSEVEGIEDLHRHLRVTIGRWIT